MHKVIILTVLFSLSAMAEKSEFFAWSESFYQESTFCSTAVIDHIRIQNQNLVVTLAIDKRWSESLETAEDNLKNRWFALHCPFVGLPTWRDSRENNIIIEGTLPTSGLYRLNCREWQASQDNAFF